MKVKIHQKILIVILYEFCVGLQAVKSLLSAIYIFSLESHDPTTLTGMETLLLNTMIIKSGAHKIVVANMDVFFILDPTN